MAKKKKSQLKPVVRGFATTSVAKKVALEAETDSNEESSVTTDADVLGSSSTLSGETGANQLKVAAVGLDSQEQTLQDLVDKFQDRVEKDVTRTVKVT